MLLHILSRIFLCSSDQTSPAGSNKTNLATSTLATGNSGCLTNMLMVTTTMGMLNWIHSNTSHLWPAVPLNPVFMESTTSFQNGLVNTSTTMGMLNWIHSNTSHLWPAVPLNP